MDETTEPKITRAELITLFGYSMPMDAFMLLYEPQFPISEIRTQLRVIASRWEQEKYTTI